MTKFIPFLIVLLISSSVSAQNLEDSLKVAEPEVKVAEPQILDMDSYKINYPSNWRVKNGCADANCSLLSPPDTVGGTSYDRFVENINIVYNKLSSSSYTVDKYADYSVSYLPKVVAGFKVIERKKLKSNVIRLTYKGEKNGFEQTWRQYYHVKAGKVYIITFAAETSKYEYFQPLVEEYLNSFIIK